MNQESTAPEVEAPPRSSWQFSLRTLFILVTLLIIALAWFVNGPERRRRAVEAIRAAGGNVMFRSDDSAVLELEDGWLPKAYTQPVRHVLLMNAKDADRLMPGVNSLDAEMVNLDRAELAEKGFAQLAGMESLQILILWEVKVTDADLAQLKRLPKLRTLFLSRCEVTNAGVAHLAEIPSLEILSLAATKITDKSLAHLQKLPRLTTFYLSETTITNDGLIHLAKIPSLQFLDLGGTKITGPGLAHLRSLPALETLCLIGAPIGDRDLAALKGFPALNYLSLESTSVSDAGIEQLLSIPKLETVYLTQTGVTAEGMVRFQNALQARKRVESSASQGEVEPQ